MHDTATRLVKVTWRYRNLILALAQRDLSVRYKGSFLGFLWTFINPLLVVVVYTIVFSTLFRSQIPFYGLYVFSGQLIWAAIAGSFNEAAVAMVTNAGLITRAALPPEVVPARVVIGQLINYTLTLPLYFVAAAAFGFSSPFSWTVLQLPLVLPLIFVFLYSAILGISVIGGIFRDVQHLVVSLTFVLFFTTPVMYQFDMLPAHLQAILRFSPATIVVKMVSDILFFGKMVAWFDVALLSVWSVIIMSLSLVSLKFLRVRIAEKL